MFLTRIIAVGLAVVLVVAGTACQSPGEKRETPVPERAVAPPPTPAVDAVPEIPETVGLEELIGIALARNASIVQARKGVAIARADVDTTFGQVFLPRIVAAAQLTALRPVPELSTAFGSFATQPDTSTQTSISVQMPLFHPAEAFYGYPAAMLGTRLATLSRERTEQQIRSLVTSAFFQRLSLENRREVVREFIRSLERQVKDTRIRVDAGAAIENDVLKIELELTRQKQTLVEADNAVEVAAMQLNTLLALPRHTSYELSWDAPFALASLAPADVLVSRAHDSRPDLEAENVGIRQLTLSRKREKAGFYPTLDGFATWNHTNPTTQSNADVTTLGFSLNWELFDGNVRNSRAARIGHEIAQAQVRLADAKRAVAIEVETALRQLENQASAVTLGGIAVEQAKENLRVQRALYKNQRSTANDLLEAEVQLTNARDTVIQATFAYEIALGALEAAVGVDREGLAGE